MGHNFGKIESLDVHEYSYFKVIAAHANALTVFYAEHTDMYSMGVFVDGFKFTTAIKRTDPVIGGSEEEDFVNNLKGTSTQFH